MILTADSGSTTTVWTLSDGSGSRTFTTPGLNPYHLTSGEISRTLSETLPAGIAEGVREVWFYGSGCTEAKIPEMKFLLEDFFPGARIEAASDLLGACRGLCGESEGIVCILGTGSNSCLWDGRKIVAHTPPLGYILGDEGSGSAIGKAFAADCLKGILPEKLKKEFLAAHALTEGEIIERVYRRPMANRFLAGFAPFIAAHSHLPGVGEIVAGSFRSFLRRNVAAYGKPGAEINFTGSVAWHFADLLSAAVAGEGYRVGKIVQSPAEGIAAYHNRKR